MLQTTLIDYVLIVLLTLISVDSSFVSFSSGFGTHRLRLLLSISRLSSSTRVMLCVLYCTYLLCTYISLSGGQLLSLFASMSFAMPQAGLLFFILLHTSSSSVPPE